MIKYVDNVIGDVPYRFYFELDAAGCPQILGMKELINGVPTSINMKEKRFTKEDVEGAVKEVIPKIRNSYLN